MQTKQRVLIATGIYPPEIGGPATYAKLLVDKLPSYDIDVQVIPFRDVRKYPKIIRHIAYFFKILRYSFSNDLIFTQDPVSTGLPSLFASFVSGKPLVIRVAGDYAWEQSAQRYGVKDTIDEFQSKKYDCRIEILKFIQSFVVRYATEVVTPSIYFQSLVSGWVKGKRKINKIYNGIDLSIEFDKEQKYEVPTLITAGRLVPWKGIDVLISLVSRLPDWQLLIAGDGPDSNRLKELSKSLNMDSRVHFLGNLERKKLFSEIYKSHIFVLNTSFESFSFQIVEAMFVGTPIISTNIGNISEIVTDNVNGILVEPNNTEQFISAINKVYNDKKFSDLLVKESKEKAKLFSIESTISQMVEIFKKYKRL
jgi:glycosyltransferase involved in cell wall biosynthesis